MRYSVEGGVALAGETAVAWRQLGVSKRKSIQARCQLVSLLPRWPSRRSTGPVTRTFRASTQAVLSKGLKHLLSKVKANGEIADGPNCHLHHHGVATIALCEAYARTRDSKLRSACQAAVDFIVSAQHQTTGGWRYRPGDEGSTASFGWQVMALKWANKGGLRVPPRVFAGAKHWLNLVQQMDGATYSYLPRGAVSPSMSAVGLLCRTYEGWDRKSAAFQKGVRYVSDGGPKNQLYADYFTTCVMQAYGGEEWQTWCDRLHDRLLASQDLAGDSAGSWALGDDHLKGAVGRLGITSFCLMSLEVGM